MRDFIIRGMTKDGFIKAMAAQTTNTVEEARHIHRTLPLATAALGRVLTAVSMMGNELKVEDGSVTLQIKGGGPLGTITAVSDHQGNTRGYLQNPAVELPLKASGKLDVGAGVGSKGILTVIKDIGGREPFTGKVELVSGEIAEDLASYFAVSEQIPTVCALGVLVGKEQSVLCAGGYILQLMPGAPDWLIQELEARLAAFGSVTARLSSGEDVERTMYELLNGLGFEVFERHEICYQCKCSRRKVESVLLSMGKQELKGLAESDEPTHVTCQFCDKEYSFSQQEIKHILEAAEGGRKYK